jgi:hypothetical protein
MVRIWKVILATLVIFGAGVITGGLVIQNVQRLNQPTHVNGAPAGSGQTPANFGLWPRQATNLPSSGLAEWHIRRTNFIHQVDRELGLSPEQRQRIEAILRDSQRRTKEISDRIAPEIRDEVKEARTRIHRELNPAQQQRFEEMFRPRTVRKPDETPRPEKRPGGDRRDPRTPIPDTSLLPPPPPPPH